MNNDNVVNLYGFPLTKEREKLAEALDKSKTKITELMKLANLARVSLVVAQYFDE